MKDPDIRPMTRTELEDEVMLLRAQVKVLRDSHSLMTESYWRMRKELGLQASEPSPCSLV